MLIFSINVEAFWPLIPKRLEDIGFPKALKLLEHHSDDTSRRGVSFGNSILKISTNAGYENVSLSLAIFVTDGTAESGVDAIQCTFSEGHDLLKNWRDVTRCMFPD